MEYEKLVCKFCKECIGKKLNIKIIKSESKVNSDTIAIRCDNFYPKDEFESNIM